MQKRADELDAELKGKADDVDLLKEAADLAAVLGNMKKSSSLAERVTQAEPSNSQAWLAVVGLCPCTSGDVYRFRRTERSRWHSARRLQLKRFLMRSNGKEPSLNY